MLSVRLASSALIDDSFDRLDLAEIFHVDWLRSDTLDSHRVRRLGSRLRIAPYLHVQIRRNDQAILCGHVVGKDDSWDVGNLFGSALAPVIEERVAWMDQYWTEPGEVRLLLVPECSVVAFRLVQQRRDRMILVSGQPRHRHLQEGRDHSPHAFLSALFGDDYTKPLEYHRARSNEKRGNHQYDPD